MEAQEQKQETDDNNHDKEEEYEDDDEHRKQKQKEMTMRMEEEDDNIIGDNPRCSLCNYAHYHPVDIYNVVSMIPTDSPSFQELISGKKCGHNHHNIW